jgi:hypothetical protein
MMEWRHGIHKMGHVTSAGFKHLVQQINLCSRVTDGNNPALVGQLTRERHSAFHLGSKRHHVFQISIF